MEPDDRGQGRTASGQLQGEGAAEAVADGRHLGGVGVLVSEQDVETGPGDGTDPVGVTRQRPEALTHLLRGKGLALPVVVEGEGHIAQLGQTARGVLRVVAQPGGVMGDEHGWAASRVAPRRRPGDRPTGPRR